MELTTCTNKIMLATILTTGLALAISQAALAQPATPDVQGKKDTTVSRPQMDADTQKAHDKFLSETVATRKEMAEKNAALQVLLNAGTPDTAKASQLAGELFELREKLRAKAKENGLPMMMGHGDMTTMPCQGMGMGTGMGRRHHRM